MGQELSKFDWSPYRMLVDLFSMDRVAMGVVQCTIMLHDVWNSVIHSLGYV